MVYCRSECTSTGKMIRYTERKNTENICMIGVLCRLRPDAYFRASRADLIAIQESVY